MKKACFDVKMIGSFFFFFAKQFPLGPNPLQTKEIEKKGKGKRKTWE